MFFTPDSPRGSFVVHFTNDPASDFGIWARGYQEASSGKMAQISENIIYGTEDLSRIDDIIALIEGTLPPLYEEEKRLEAALPES